MAPDGVRQLETRMKISTPAVPDADVQGTSALALTQGHPVEGGAPSLRGVPFNINEKKPK